MKGLGINFGVYERDDWVFELGLDLDWLMWIWLGLGM